ncbi:uncharacterized protein N0V89_011153 [Didymosphaeria variabile]|uniref:Isochorismatase-like domain-containing protein n=1 Tax=Didymosphaeria variabile TaxID=1932322 RepID=A0A9W8XCJ9_9PLEO|nr:uncharacterized protein N0V89_011153 [Didymosphaeria variabile]KAJ4347214.1 hypothetical protein N0V89_011153 [Didymosphaeria variabile]
MNPTTLLSFLSLAILGHTQPSPSSTWTPWERISQNDSALLIVDQQVGLFQLTRDWDPTVYKQNMLGHAALGKLFDIPVVMTTSAETGPNGPLPREIRSMYPAVEVVQRRGEINAWDSPEFRAAVRATGKKQMIIGGIVTDVCTSFLTLSLRSEGYSVFANVEASGTTSPLVRDTANLRMQAAGVHLVSQFAIAGDLMRDWRNPSPGVEAVVEFIDDYMPVYGMYMRGHAAAILKNGTVLPGVEKLI